MQVSQPVRVSLLSLTAVMATGLLWAGVKGYRAEQRAVQLNLGGGPFAVGQANPIPSSIQPPSVQTPSVQAFSPSPSTLAARPKLVVHVTGAVHSPSVYRLELGARVVDAIEAAGGALPEGEPDVLNLAEPLADGDKVYICTTAEVSSDRCPPPTALGLTHFPVATAKAAAPAVVRLNINRATAQQLESLTGIGPKTAAAILEYRQRNGPFKRLEDLLMVKGVGPSLLEKIRAEVTL